MYNQLLAMIMNCKRILIINILTSQWTYKACTGVWFLYQHVKTMVLIGLNSMNTVNLFMNSMEFYYNKSEHLVASCYKMARIKYNKVSS